MVWTSSDREKKINLDFRIFVMYIIILKIINYSNPLGDPSFVPGTLLYNQIFNNYCDSIIAESLSLFKHT